MFSHTFHIHLHFMFILVFYKFPNSFVQVFHDKISMLNKHNCLFIYSVSTPKFNFSHNLSKMPLYFPFKSILINYTFHFIASFTVNFLRILARHIASISSSPVCFLTSSSLLTQEKYSNIATTMTRCFEVLVFKQYRSCHCSALKLYIVVLHISLLKAFHHLLAVFPKSTGFQGLSPRLSLNLFDGDYKCKSYPEFARRCK